MDIYDEKSQVYSVNKREFLQFLTNETDGVYQERIKQMLKNEQTRLVINLNDLRVYNPELTSNFMRAPMQYLAPFQAALKEYISTLPVSNEYPPINPEDSYTLGIDGNFGGQRLSPRQLHARQLGQLVCVEGIATRCSIVRPKVLKTVHYCEKTSQYNEMTYHDSTSISGYPTSSIYPTKDIEGNPLTTEFGLSTYFDHQTLVIQEMPERAPAGLLPSSVDVVLDNDLVDSCKPGDRVAIIGIYRALPSKSAGFTSGIFRTVLIANYVKHLGKTVYGNANTTETDVRNIRKLSHRHDIFELLSRSVAPSIFGHDFIKKAIILLLLGGVEKNLDNGTHIRGDINMLFVGDPSTAKSQLLRFILNIAPLALNTTGRGSSGVGLTAAVTHDKETGERRLEAGAMVLADRGVVCIDEFDKMSDMDRVAIHEVMEQQTVTIAKAGIHMSLNARCSVVAAANPRYSQYDSSKTTSWNVNLPDSLISRFDFLFIVLDTPDPEHDREVADKVLSNHRYLNKANAIDSEEINIDDNDRAAEDLDTEVWQKFDKVLHTGLLRRHRTSGRTNKLELLSIPFMKKYIQFAKESSQPVLTPEAADFIGKQYAQLRTRDEREKKNNSFPVTARSLETLIRLSSAHAKARLSDTVEEHDCEKVMEILRFALEGVDKEPEASSSSSSDDEDEQRPPSTRVRTPRRNANAQQQQQQAAPVQADEEASAAAAASPSKRKRTPSKPVSASKRSRVVEETAADDEEPSSQRDDDDAVPPSPSPTSSDRATRASTAVAAPTFHVISTARVSEFQKELVAYTKSIRSESVLLTQFLRHLNSRSNAQEFSEEDAETILKRLEKENSVMYRGGTIYRV